MNQSKFLATALTLIIVWGSAFTMIDVAVRSVSPIWLVATRIILGAILVTAYVYMKGLRLPPLSHVIWRWYALLGMTGMVLPFFLVSVGQKTIESGISAILIGAMPLITIILAHFATSEKMTRMKFFGFLIGFSGLIILFIPRDFSLSLISDWKAQSLILLAAFFYAITTVVIWALIEGIPATPPEPIAYWMILGLAIGSTGFATILYLNMIDVKGPTIMASINYFVPVASVVFGIWFLGETLTLQKLIAFFVIIAGVATSRIKPKKKTVTT